MRVRRIPSPWGRSGARGDAGSLVQLTTPRTSKGSRSGSRRTISTCWPGIKARSVIANRPLMLRLATLSRRPSSSHVTPSMTKRSVAFIRSSTPGRPGREHEQRRPGPCGAGGGRRARDGQEEGAPDELVAGVVGVLVVGEEPGQVAGLDERAVGVGESGSLLPGERLDEVVHGRHPLVAL